jgi:hypothetical protein
MAVNFKLVSEFQTIHRRPFELADPSVLDPTSVSPVPLVDGEWLEHDSAYRMARGGSGAVGAPVPSFVFFAEQGRYETQAIQKGPFLYMGDYEADTLIMDATGVTLGMALVVTDVTVSALVRRGLSRWPAVPAGTEKVMGYVTRLPANNNGYLRFIKVG